jgi:hypothetical protein
VIRALSLGCLCLCACDWLSASGVEANYCAQFEQQPATADRVALLQPCTVSADCLCPRSLCLSMVVPDGGAELRCNPPDSAQLCPLFYDSSVVHWSVGDDCLDSCNSGGKQCVGIGGGGSSGCRLKHCT